MAVATSKKGSGVRKLTLLGGALPYKSATLYLKVSGYLSKIAVDKGDHVKAGQFIAEINSPEWITSAAVHWLIWKTSGAWRTQRSGRPEIHLGAGSRRRGDQREALQQQVAGVKALTSYKVLTAPFAVW